MLSLVIGGYYKSKKGGWARLVGMVDAETAEVVFESDELDLKCTGTVPVYKLQNESFTSPFDRTVHGVGYLGNGPYNSTDHQKCYHRWWNRLRYIFKCEEKNMSYWTVMISDDFLCFQNFAKWHYSQIGHDEIGFELDKDLLSTPGCLSYSAETCCFLPKKINLLLSHLNRGNGSYLRLAQLAEEYKHLIDERAYVRLKEIYSFQ